MTRDRLARAAAFGLLVTAGCSLTACTSTPAELPAGVDVSLTQFRDDYGRRVVQIVVAAGDSSPLTLTRAGLSASGFDGVAERDRRVEIPAGTARDLPVVLGEPKCDEASGHPRVTLDFVAADGRAGHAVVSPDDPLDVLGDTHSADCLVEAVDEVAHLAPAGFRVEGVGSAAVGVLDFQVAPDGADGADDPVLRIDRVDRTILLRPADGSPSWTVGRDIRGDDDPSTIELRLIPSNCNPHILAEDKRGTFWPFEVSLSGGPKGGLSGTTFVATDTALKAQLYAYMGEYCGWPTG